MAEADPKDGWRRLERRCLSPQARGGLLVYPPRAFFFRPEMRELRAAELIRGLLPSGDGLT